MPVNTNHPKSTIAEIIRGMFEFELSQCLPIKHALNSFIKSGLIQSNKEKLGGGKDSRSRIWIEPGQKDLIYNIIVLQAVFSDSKTITRILQDQSYRQKMADFASMILVDKQSVIGISLLSDKTYNFIKLLKSDTDLRNIRLTSPFDTLPQLILNQSTNTMQLLVTQAASLAGHDSMMIHYLNNDLESAWEAAQSVEINDERLGKYKALIEKEYQEAKEFDELLNFLQ
jgi:hypothetical protein